MSVSGEFRPVPAATEPVTAQVGSRTPAVFRGLAAGWPALSRWSLPRIASLAPDLQVTLVHGNRESNSTVLSTSTLGAYLGSLQDSPRQPDTGGPPGYLKEFDLLKVFPGLRADLHHDQLFPPGSITSCGAWIGPAGARTGLHRDLLDNLAVQILGHKRFYLAAPGTVQRRGAASRRYDRWARLSAVSAEELAHSGDPGLYATDLHPGDVLFVPAGWWHEVANHDPSLLLSGFFGPRAAVLARWVTESTRNGLHLVRLLGTTGCTCHPAEADGW
jgi:hypothetical protein